MLARGYVSFNLLIKIDLLAIFGFEGPTALTVEAVLFHGPRELAPPLGVQRSEDARNLTSLRARRRSPGDLEQPPGNRRRKISAMPLE